MKSLGVIGLGYVGLPLAVQAAEKGYRVVGVDVDRSIIELVNNRRSPYVGDIRFEKAILKIPDELLVATNDYAQLSSVDCIVLCVPTPTENNIPDLGLVATASRQVADILRKGQLVILESTVNPGVTRDLVLPILEESTGLTVGKDFYLAHCPERIDPGNDTYFVGNLNRVVGGITSNCTKKAEQFYTDIIDAKILCLGSTEEAEFVKSWENSHRNVMIALANSAAIICDALEMDISRVLDGLQTKVDQFGLSLAKPGIGPGGHCIPEDIHYVIKRARQSGIDTRFLDDAADLNDKMPSYAIRRLGDMIRMNGQAFADVNVALLGLSYKPNIADIRRSPSIEVGYQLLRNAKSVVVYDPFINDKSPTISGTLQVKSLAEALKNAEAIFIATAHSSIVNELTPELLKEYGIKYVLDGRNALDVNMFRQSDIKYRGIGR